MAQAIKAIETKFDGILFRSRIEARWATFYRELEIEYEYEKEGFDLGTEGWYLPDFWLPGQDCWVEIKGAEPTLDEIVRGQRLARLSGKNVHIFFGGIPYPRGVMHDLVWDDRGTIELRRLGLYGNGRSSLALFATPKTITTSNSFHETLNLDFCYWWTECQDCGRFGLEYEGRNWRMPCHCDGTEAMNAGYNWDSRRLLEAYEQARTSRFDGKPSKRELRYME